jgi:hypothetical protein
MVRARICKGRVEVEGAIPDAWEGQVVKIVPLTPDDQSPDLEARLAALHAMGPMEFEPGEWDRILESLREVDRLSKEAAGRVGP